MYNNFYIVNYFQISYFQYPYLHNYEPILLQRFNVALTRAMSKLIVIGCAQVLGTDKKWLKYINLCKQQEAFYGAPYEKRDKEVMAEITKRFANIEFQDNWSNGF